MENFLTPLEKLDIWCCPCQWTDPSLREIKRKSSLSLVSTNAFSVLCSTFTQ